MVSCPFAQRLVAYNNDVGENERLTESGKIGFETLKDIAFVSSDRFLTLNENEVLEYNADGEFQGVFAEHADAYGTLTSLHVFTPTNSVDLHVAVSACFKESYNAPCKNSYVYVTTYVEGKDGGKVDLDGSEIIDANMFIRLSSVSLDYGLTLNAENGESISSMTEGATPDEILLTTSFWYDQVPEGETEATAYPGGRLVRVCVPNTPCSKAAVNRVQVNSALTAVVTLPSKGSILYVEKAASNGDWHTVRELPLDDADTSFPKIFSDSSPTSYRPTDIVVDDKLELVYIETPDLTRVFNYYGIFLKRFEGKIGYTTEPDQLALKPGIFSHLSTYETYTSDDDDAAPNTTVVAGETLTARVLLRDKYNELITEDLNEYEKVRMETHPKDIQQIEEGNGRGKI